jgi:hypothetical protein
MWVVVVLNSAQLCYRCAWLPLQGTAVEGTSCAVLVASNFLASPEELSLCLSLKGSALP